MHSSGSSITLSKQRRQRSASSQASSLVVADLDLGEADAPVGRASPGSAGGRWRRSRCRGGESRRGGQLDAHARRRGGAAASAAWIDAAARCPSAIASMRLRGPWATSPPAQIRGCEVRSVAGSTWMPPRGCAPARRRRASRGRRPGRRRGSPCRPGAPPRCRVGTVGLKRPSLVEHRLDVDRLEPGDASAFADEAVRALR